MKKKLTIAFPKGRLFKETVDLFLKAGLLEEPIEEGRKLFIDVGNFIILLTKPKDVPTLVESGLANLGVCGLDILMETNKNVYKILNLNIGKCRICVAGFPEKKEEYKNLSSIKVATKYPNIAKDFFEKKGIKPFIYILNGSVELAPIIGMTDYILDLVQTGRTLKENGLVVIEEIAHSSAYLICNRESFYLYNPLINDLLEKLEETVEKI
jgi:ATP phosphoribosyltransferase